MREEPEAAATLIIFRRAAAGGAPELLMVERSAGLVFAGGATVFPGGRLEPVDYQLAAHAHQGLDPDEAAHRIAAIRETLEETGLLLATDRPVSAAEVQGARSLTFDQLLDRLGVTMQLDQLIPWARWCPPVALHARTFDTRFYIADAGSGGQLLEVDATENRRLFWASASEVLARADAGEQRIIFPTRRNLERLARCGSFEGAAHHAAAHAVRLICPRMIERDGQRFLTIPDGLGYPVLEEPFETASRV